MISVLGKHEGLISLLARSDWEEGETGWRQF